MHEPTIAQMDALTIHADCRPRMVRGRSTCGAHGPRGTLDLPRWAFTQVKQGDDTMSPSQEESPRVSVLGRIGYLAPKDKTHPHLKQR